MLLVMPRGRPSKLPRSGFGHRLWQARLRAGLSQEQLAAKVGVAQRTIAYWERQPALLRPDQLVAVAKMLKVSVEALLCETPPVKAAKGPVGKVRQVFEAVNALPRRQQEKIVEVVQALVAQHTAGRSRVA